MKILIVTEHASARFGGESILPIHWFNYLRDAGDEVWLLLNERNQHELREIFGHCQDKIFFVEDTVWQQRLARLRSRLSSRILQILIEYLIHLLTQYRQRGVARDVVAKLEIEIVLEPMPVSPRQPSLMFGLGAPVVIGPMNGGMSFPPGFHEREHSIDRFLIAMARHLSGLLNFAAPGKRKAACLLVANERTAKSLPWSVSVAPVHHLVENGVDTRNWGMHSSPVSRDTKSKFSFAFVGRLVDWKAVDILLDAFASLPDQFSIDLHIFGDGPERIMLEEHALRVGNEENIIFHGFVKQADLPVLLLDCECLVLPSLRECGGAVVLEAMCLGLPVIATNWGGPADYLDESCGILVDPVNAVEFRVALADAMQRLRSDRSLCRALGDNGRAKVQREFTWPAKIQKFKGILRQHDYAKERSPV